MIGISYCKKEPYDLTHMWDTKQKANKLIGIDNSLVVTRGKGRGENKGGEGGHIYGDGRRLDLGWRAYKAVYR